MVQRVAVLGAAVGAVHPCAFHVWIHCHDVGSLGRCPTGSRANTVLARFGLLASPGIPFLDGMTWGAF